MTDINLTASRLVSYTLMLVTSGLPLHAFLDQRKHVSAGQRVALMLLAAGAIVSSLWWAIANVAAMAGLSILTVDATTLAIVLKATPLGTLLALRVTALMVLIALLALHVRSLFLALTAIFALVTCAWAGHASAGEDTTGVILRISDCLHLVAASLWLSALLVFATDLIRPGRFPQLLTSLTNFASIGTIVVTVLFASGCANTWLVSGGQLLLNSPWTLLIWVKAILFLAMLGLAAHNRWYLVPRFRNGIPGARSRLHTSLILETACGLVIVCVVAFAGLLDPLSPL